MSDTKLLIRLVSDVESLKNGMRKARSEVSGFQKFTQGAAQSIGGFFAFTAVLNGIKSLITGTAELGRQFGLLKAISGANAIQAGVLNDKILTLGATTEFTSTAIAAMATELARGGFSPDEIQRSAQSIINLSTATGSDLTRAAEVASTTMRGFGLSASEMGRVVDTITFSLNNSQLSLDSFAEAIKFVAPNAKVAGVSIEETATLLQILADSGIKGSQAGTSLRKIMTLLTKDGKPLIERLRELAAAGINVASANDEVGLTAQTSLLVIARQIGKFDELRTKTEQARGETERLAKVIRDDLMGDIDRLLSSIDGAAKGLGRAFEPVFRVITQRLTNIIDFLKFIPTPLEAIKGALEGIIPDRIAGNLLESGLTNSGKKINDVIKPIADLSPVEFFRDKNVKEKFFKALQDEGEELDTVTQLWKVFFDTRLKGLKESAKAEVEDARAKKLADEADAIAAATLRTQKLREERAKANKERLEGIDEFVRLFNEVESARRSTTRSGDRPDSPSVNISGDPFGGVFGQREFAKKITEKAESDALKNIEENLMRMQQLKKSIERSLVDTTLDVSSLFGEMAAGAKSAADAMRSSARVIINELANIAIAQVLAAQSKLGIPGIVAGVAAIGFIRGIFSGLLGGGGGGRTTEQFSTAGQAVNFSSGERNTLQQVEFKVKGRDLVGVLSEQDRLTQAISG